MRTILGGLLVLLSIWSPMGVAFETPEALIKSGLDAYAEGNTAVAIDNWVGGSALAGSEAATSQADALRRLKAHYGAYEGYEIVHQHDLAKRSRMILMVMNFQTGAIYGRFQVYKSNSGDWVLTEFRFSVEAARIWPSTLVFGQ